jgi:transcriptional regulator with GAF, ATPase, and Fis domain
VRELENVIARATILSTPPIFKLPEGWNRESHAFHDTAVSQSINSVDNSVDSNSQATDHSEESLAALEKAHIVEILQQTNWRIEGEKGAALILGLHPNTLRSRMRKIGIQKPPRTTTDDPPQTQSNGSVESS